MMRDELRWPLDRDEEVRGLRGGRSVVQQRPEVEIGRDRNRYEGGRADKHLNSLGRDTITLP